MSNFRLYGTIEKVSEESDGTLRVEGICSSEIQDAQGETITASAMEKAIPGYLRKDGTGPLREMHQPIAAGKTTAIDVQPDGKTYVVTKVVDKGAIQKVKEKVLQGFSIGGSVPPGGRSKDNPKIIERIELTEISLVDRPANPDAVFTLVKVAVDPAPAALPPAADAPVPAPVIEKKAAPAKPAPEAAKKGMYTVGYAAQLCDALMQLAKDTEFEAEYEGDGSEIPARLKALCRDFAGILKDLVVEEADELIGTEKAEGSAAIVLVNKPGALKKSEKLAAIARAFQAAAKGAPPADADRLAESERAVEKAGEALRKVLVERDDLHKKLGDANLLLKARGVPKDPKFLEASAKAEELQKAVVDAQDATEKAGAALKKVMTERDDLLLQRNVLQKQIEEQVAKYTASLTEIGEEKEELTRQRDEYVKKFAVADVALKTKGYLKAVPISKRDDTGDGNEPEPEGSKPPENTEARALYELKKIQRAGGKPLLPASNGG